MTALSRAEGDALNKRQRYRSQEIAVLHIEAKETGLKQCSSWDGEVAQSCLISMRT